MVHLNVTLVDVLLLVTLIDECYIVNLPNILKCLITYEHILHSLTPMYLNHFGDNVFVGSSFVT